jgi:hypothetical protein
MGRVIDFQLPAACWAPEAFYCVKGGMESAPARDAGSFLKDRDSRRQKGLFGSKSNPPLKGRGQEELSCKDD